MEKDREKNRIQQAEQKIKAGAEKKEQIMKNKTGGYQASVLVWVLVWVAVSGPG